MNKCITYQIISHPIALNVSLFSAMLILGNTEYLVQVTRINGEYSALTCLFLCDNPTVMQRY